MTETHIPWHESIRVLWMYLMVDLCMPLIMIILVQYSLHVQLWNSSYCWLGGKAGLICALLTFFLSGYGRYVDYPVTKKNQLVFKTWGLTVFLLTFIAYLNVGVFSFPRSVILIWIVITPFIIYLIKLIISINVYHNKVYVAVLGDGYHFTEFEKQLLSRQNIELIYLSITKPSNLKRQMEKISINYLLINLSKTADNKLIQELTDLYLIEVKLISLNNFMEKFLLKCYIPYESSDLIYLERIRAYDKFDYILKRIFDIILATVLCIICMPVMIYSAIKIRRESPGPIIFSQARVGRFGKEHIIYKFRSMHVDAEINGAQFAQANDPRAYSFGAFMRKTRIDELPQLWNVIKGDLHFVGPRPERKIFTNQLEEDIPYYNERHLVSPGITGWAQVLYPYGANTEDARQKLMYDLYYIKHWSILLDLEVLVRTVGVVIGRKGL